MGNKEQQIKDVMEALGLARAEAEEYVAIANGESVGDVVNVDDNEVEDTSDQ